MSDNAQIVVDTEASAEQSPELANAVRAWLVEQQIIEQEQSDSVLGGAGHRPGINYRAAIQADKDYDFLDLWTNGVEIAVGRRVFDAGGNGIELLWAPVACPSNLTIRGPTRSVHGSTETISLASPAPHAANKLS